MCGAPLISSPVCLPRSPVHRLKGPALAEMGVNLTQPKLEEFCLNMQPGFPRSGPPHTWCFSPFVSAVM